MAKRMRRLKSLPERETTQKPPLPRHRRRRLVIGAVAAIIPLLVASMLWTMGFFRSPAPKIIVNPVDEQVIEVMRHMLEAWKGALQEPPTVSLPSDRSR